MRVVCSKCGTEGSSKCPDSRNIFPSRESEGESHFWHGMGFMLKPAGDGWKPGVMRLHVTMIVDPEEDEATAMERFVKKMQRIPKDKMDRYLCKHSYQHTTDCVFCGFKMEASV